MAVHKRTYVDFSRNRPIGNTAVALGVPVSTDQAINLFWCGQTVFEFYNDDTNTDIIPTVDTSTTNGWIIPNDSTDNEGICITQGVAALSTTPYAFTIGTDPAFKLSVKFKIPDVSDYDVACVGFRKAEASADCHAHAATITTYTDVALLNVNIGAIYSGTRLNTGSGTLTDTTNTWADNASKTLTVLVSAAGVVTFQIDGASPTVNTNTLTFDSTDVVIPFVQFCKNSSVASDTPPILLTWFCGYQ